MCKVILPYELEKYSHIAEIIDIIFRKRSIYMTFVLLF